MTALTIFNGAFCDADSVVKEVVNITGHRLVTDMDVIDEAARLSGMSQDTILMNFPSGRDVREHGRPDQSHVFSVLRFAMAEMASEEHDLIFWGYMALLPPPEVENLLRVCLISDMDARLCAVRHQRGCSETEAKELIRADDQVRADLVLAATNCNDPWGRGLYDLLVPVAATGVKESAHLVAQQLSGMAQEPLCFRKSMENFLLEAKVRADLADKGHDVSVSAREKSLTLRFDDHQKVLKNMSCNLAEAASAFDGVEGVEVGVGSRYNQNDIYEVLPRQRPSGSHSLGRAENPIGLSDDCAGDVALAVEIQDSFLREELDVSVFVKRGFVSIAINDHSKMIKHLARNLCDVVSESYGIKNVEIGIGGEYHQIDGYRRVRRNCAKSCLADDKREFALAMSDRLQQRAGGGSFVYLDRPVKKKTLPNAIRAVSKNNRVYSYR